MLHPEEAVQELAGGPRLGPRVAPRASRARRAAVQDTSTSMTSCYLDLLHRRQRLIWYMYFISLIMYGPPREARMAPREARWAWRGWRPPCLRYPVARGDGGGAPRRAQLGFQPQHPFGEPASSRGGAPQELRQGGDPGWPDALSAHGAPHRGAWSARSHVSVCT